MISIITLLKCINCQAEAFVYFDCKEIATAHKDIEINPQSIEIGSDNNQKISRENEDQLQIIEDPELDFVEENLNI